MEKGIASFSDRVKQENAGMDRVRAYFERVGGPVTPASKIQQIEQDIDLNWDFKGHNKTIEVKVDWQGHSTRNMALETVSNEIRGTRGCFMRSEADFFAYFFIESRELYVFKMQELREWFIKELSKRPNRFREFTTHTKLDSGIIYPSYGRLVPIREALGSGCFYVFSDTV
jgi:hypothetical protein